MDQQSNIIEFGVFRILMMGKRGFFSNYRILTVHEKEVAYYSIPSENKETAAFLMKFNALENQTSGNLTNQDLNSSEFVQLGKLFGEISKKFEKKGSIKIELLDIIHNNNDPDLKKMNTKNYLYPTILKEKENNLEGDLGNFDISKAKTINQQEKKKEKTENSWFIDMIDKGSYEKFKKIIDFRKNAMRKTKVNFEEKKIKKEELPIKIEEKKQEPKLKKEEEEKENDVVFLLYIHEYIYQVMLKNYFSIQSNSDLKKKFELAILQINSRFRDVCSILVRKIVQDLGQKTITNNSNAFYPIVFTAPKNLKDSKNAVLIYYIHGINFHVTWHQTIIKMKDSSKSADDEILRNGSWYYLEKDFKSRDFYNEILLSIHSKQTKLTSKIDFLRVPLTCIIEYLGFKIYCESDIYIDDGKLAIDDSKKVISNSGQSFNSSLIDETSKFFKELQTIFVERKNNENKPDITVDTVYLHTSAILNFLTEYKRIFSSSTNLHTLKTFFSIYYNNHLKDIESYYLTETICKFIQTGDDSNKSSSINENKNEFKNFFDPTNNLEKEIINLKYIMKLKILIKLIDKREGKEKLSYRNVYFRPEFLIKYYNDNYTTNYNENNRDSFLKELRKILLIDDFNLRLKSNYNIITNYFKETHLYNFLNSLDTFFLKPFDSQTLTEIFHSYGINMYFLGQIAILSNAPHIRELCIIEMIARIIKKMLCDLMSQKLLDKAFEEFYLNSNDHLKYSKDLENTNSEGEMLFIPVSFHIKYHKHYLKKIQVIPSITPEIKYAVDNTNKPCKGVYKKYWYRSCILNEDKNFKNLLHGITNKVEDKNQNTAKGTDKNPNPFSDINKEIAKFFNVLFNLKEGDLIENKKLEINIFGTSYKNDALWKVILERVKSHYGIKKEDTLFNHFDPCYISLPALFSSIQYHTGITVKLELPILSKYSNRDLINCNGKEFSEEQISIQSRSKMYQYRNFIINRNLHKTNVIHYNMQYDEELHKLTLLRMIIEKSTLEKATSEKLPTKFISMYTHFYFFYMNALRKMESDQSLSKDFLESLQRLYLEPKDKLLVNNFSYEDLKTQPHLKPSWTSLKFEFFLSYFLTIIENLSKDETINSSTSVGGTNISNNKINFSTGNSEFGLAQDYINEFWFADHPFLIILNLLFPRIYLKKLQSSVNFDDKIENFYLNAIKIARKSLGPTNIFFANLCEELGRYNVTTGKIYEGIKHFKMGHNIYKDYKEEFFECFFYNLKKITKYSIILGNYQEAFTFGYYQLFTNYNQFKKYDKDLHMSMEKLNIQNIIINLIYVVKTLGPSYYEKGCVLCQTLIFELNDKLNIKNILNFRDWRRHNSINKQYRKKNINKEKDYKREINIKKILSIYLKFVIRNLKGIEKDIFLKNYVHIHINEDKSVKDVDELASKFFDQFKEDSDLNKYISKILNSIIEANVSIQFENTKNLKNQGSSKDYDNSVIEPNLTLFQLCKSFGLKKLFSDKF